MNNQTFSLIALRALTYFGRSFEVGATLQADTLAAVQMTDCGAARLEDPDDLQRLADAFIGDRVAQQRHAAGKRSFVVEPVVPPAPAPAPAPAWSTLYHACSAAAAADILANGFDPAPTARTVAGQQGYVFLSHRPLTADDVVNVARREAHVEVDVPPWVRLESISANRLNETQNPRRGGRPLAFQSYAVLASVLNQWPRRLHAT